MRGLAARTVRRAVIAVVAAAACAACTVPLRAQGGLSTEGALFLLVPVGARSVGTGQTLAAAEAGTASLWGNPAGIARMTRRELALHHSQTIVATGEVLAFVYPAGKAGVVAVGAQLYDYGAQEQTIDATGTIGEVLPRVLVGVVTYAATIGSHLRAGVSYKVLQSRVDCTGPCGSLRSSVSTTALDAGLQYGLARSDSLTVGVALRSLGFRLQMNDNAQADPLPTRVHLGVQGLVPAVGRALAGATLRWSGELVNRTSLNDPAWRVGGELGLQQQLYLRAGYASGIGDATGPAFGFGFVRGKLALDLARVLGGFSSDAGQPPTYLSLRVTF